MTCHAHLCATEKTLTSLPTLIHQWRICSPYEYFRVYNPRKCRDMLVQHFTTKLSTNLSMMLLSAYVSNGSLSNQPRSQMSLQVFSASNLLSSAVWDKFNHHDRQTRSLRAVSIPCFRHITFRRAQSIRRQKPSGRERVASLGCREQLTLTR